MEKKAVIEVKQSEQSFASNLNEDFEDLDEEISGKKKVDPFQSNFPQWSSRAKNFQALFCLTMSVSGILHFCYALCKFGIAALVVYFLFRIFLCLPVTLIETIKGRYLMRPVTHSWTMVSFAKGVFFCAFAATFLTLIYKNFVTAHMLEYLFDAVRGIYPWSNKNLIILCGEEERTDLILLKNSTGFSGSPDGLANYTAHTEKTVSMILLSVFVVISAFCVILTCYKGICSLEKVLQFSVIAPILLALVVAFGTCFVPGALNSFGLMWFLDLTLLKDYELWLLAFNDTLSFLQLGTLAVCCISSHGKFSDDIMVDVLLVCLANISTYVFAATPVICALLSKSQCHRLGTFNFNSTFDAFIQISAVLYTYPQPSIFWLLTFYLEVLLHSFGTYVVSYFVMWDIIEGVVPEKINSFHVYSVFGLIHIILCAPFIFFPCRFDFPLNVSVETVVLINLLNLVMFYGIGRLNDDFYFMMGYPLPRFIYLTWITSVTLCLVFLGFSIYYDVPEYSYIYVLVPTLVYVLTALVEVFIAAKKGRVKSVFKANPDWGPNNDLLKKSRVIFNSHTVTKEFMYRQQLYRKCFLKLEDISEQNIVHLI